MNFESKTLLFLLVLFAAGALISMLAKGHFLKNLFLSLFSGVAALFAVNFLSGFTGFEIAVNPITLGISALGGAPGVIMLLISRVLFLL